MAANEGNKHNYIVGGFEFLTEEDAEKAAMDLSKIKVLETKVNTSKPDYMLAVYQKAIESKIFKTPLGWRYLTDLREKLLSSGVGEQNLIPIPLEIPMNKPSSLNKPSSKQNKSEDKPKKEFRSIFSITLNVILIIVVILMFVIASTSESDNIINYKRNITNRYSAWDEELKEREKAVREAEKRLGITDTKGYDEGDGSD
ncbi:MAG: hypothetical protein J6O61_08165 [Butyrivibrio sp.]|uniref:hypothetical protein n=1 Tax=Butyrivibrio sp. TaxID=28121 RepID=UPI001B1E44DC|nr:hypothetical protein [Butyrivibrio sp.]MBO6240790.1 hypothetical protein [Butyrivibrio sp.]